MSKEVGLPQGHLRSIRGTHQYGAAIVSTTIPHSIMRMTDFVSCRRGPMSMGGTRSTQTQ